MKRKNETPANGKYKKRAISDEEAQKHFRKGLFQPKVLQEYTQQYAKSEPYKHAVIHNLISDTLLRNVRDEIRENISFTPKETDIYKIHQSGDLANLDGLDDSSLRRLPSLLTLRDALYSSTFRKYISTVAGSGPLSGVKTDMAVNVYTPGCHLLCHDDVIGSRRVSWILYLLDPDRPWKPEWGGALRLYPTEIFKNEDGDEVKVPHPNFSVSIPPAWNQLSFFTVQPGESFHDVEEVYKRGPAETEENDGGRIRMAISGWFHIPQEGEEGYEEGLEAKLAERSSLAQLQGGKADAFDQPQPQWVKYPQPDVEEDAEEAEFSTAEIEFLLKYLNPNYLTPDTVEELSAMFSDESSLRLSSFLSNKFSARLRTYLESKDQESHPTIPVHPSYKNITTGIARPPHKHRFLYRQPLRLAPNPPYAGDSTPYDELIDTLIPSPAFHKWLSLVTGLTLTQSNILGRRFRRGMDYSLATAYEEDEPQLEICLGITPSTGWGDDDGAEEATVGVEEDDEQPSSNGSKSNGKEKAGSSSTTPPKQEFGPEDSVGGYEMYMAGDDDDDDDDGGDATDAGAEASTHTGAGHRRRTKADPAVYRSSADEEDDGVLFSMPAGWNNLSVVLRDKGVLRFVKYVNRAARGDRWDISGEFAVEFGEESEDEEK
ncbi:hypothetical protein K432DRAFT_380733 [Lepidopterella palustris CBS 459.81]|uniref:uS12 prolyl 3,4-dihydroxylase n=1 Tax=Lepidopterella palustris CBS 459.81 TaxID=1314670 RepID=A0A8E2EDL3_9PEZI|nr:hypothetical protein K432DRAFT_380733 [Lepidopterella palustris CBS 459.81]